MSLWGLFVILGAIGVVLSLGAAVLRPRDRASQRRELRSEEFVPRGTPSPDGLAALQSRVEALEIEVDDLQRAISTLREENEYLQQRIDGDVPGSRTGEYS